MKLVLIRHGESAWNLENRFTGWKDVDLSPKGIEEAKAAGKILKEMNLVFDVAYTSYLKRAIKTLNIVLEEMDELYIPVYKSWRLNERHYGALFFTLFVSSSVKSNRVCNNILCNLDIVSLLLKILSKKSLKDKFSSEYLYSLFSKPTSKS